MIALRDARVINDQTLRAIERDLDLEALRAGATDPAEAPWRSG